MRVFGQHCPGSRSVLLYSPAVAPAGGEPNEYCLSLNYAGGVSLGLVFNLNLKAAVGLHMNGDALYKSINLPVHQLNYNGRAPRISWGEYGTLSDGFFLLHWPKPVLV